MVDLGSSDLGLFACAPKRGHHGAPRVDNHAVAVAHSLLVVPPYLPSLSAVISNEGTAMSICTHLRGGDDVALCLDGPGSQQHFPMGLTCRDGKRGREGDDIGSKALQGDADLWEPKLDT
jgi:hypothetical protein